MSDTSPSETIEVQVDERTNMVHYIVPGEQITKELFERGIKAVNAPHTKVHNLVVQPEA